MGPVLRVTDWAVTRAGRVGPALVALLTVLVLHGAWSAGEAHANGAHEDSIEAYYGAAGDIVVRVEAIPVVGDLHLVVYLTEKDDSPVQGAEVQATAMGPGEEPLIVGPAANVPQTEYDPSLYSVTLLGALDEGVWDVTLDIQPEGLTVQFPIELKEPSSFNELLIAVLAAFVIFLGWMVFSWRRQARRRRAATR